ncbi:kelch-like protein 3 [Ptychodera flava]|uniref:kelch-like protein 3 n=1 Tax=Ptychodera flava TaxID=63121 RepID=UPI003969F5B0
MKNERSRFGLVNLHGYLYAVGGLDKDNKSLKSVERYNIATNKWQIIAPLPACRYDMAIAVYDDKIIIVGGQHSVKADAVDVLDVQVFDPAINEWVAKAKPSCVRSQGSSLVVDNKLYIAGGHQPSAEDSSKTEVCNFVEEFNDEHNSWTMVSQALIPKNDIGAFRVNSHVYFSLCGHSYDSNITIPHNEVYDVDLDDWVKLKQNTNGAAITEFTFNSKKLK